MTNNGRWTIDALCVSDKPEDVLEALRVVATNRDGFLQGEKALRAIDWENRRPMSVALPAEGCELLLDRPGKGGSPILRARFKYRDLARVTRHLDLLARAEWNDVRMAPYETWFPAETVLRSWRGSLLDLRSGIEGDETPTGLGARMV